MNSEDRTEALRLLGEMQATSPSPSALVPFIREFQALGFLPGVHQGLKRLSQAFAHSPLKSSFLQQVARELPDLLVDLGILLVSERESDVQEVLPTLLGLVFPCVPTGLRELVLVERVLQRFPDAEDTFFLPSVSLGDSNDPLLRAKVLDYQYRLAKTRRLLPLTAPGALISRFESINPDLRARILLDLMSLRTNEELKPLVPKVLSGPNTVKDLLQAISYNDEYLVSAASLLISLGQASFLPELDPYSVLYHFLSLLEWSQQTFLDILLEQEAELLELLLAFAKEAKVSGLKWQRYVYVWRVYEERRREVNEFLAELCELLESRRSLLHFNPSALLARLYPLL